MSSEVQVGLLVAVATLLAGGVPATVSWLANREMLRHDRLAWCGTSAVETFSDSHAEWRQALKESKVRFIIAARRDLGYDASAGSPRATQSLHEPG